MDGKNENDFSEISISSSDENVEKAGENPSQSVDVVDCRMFVDRKDSAKSVKIDSTNVPEKRKSALVLAPNRLNRDIDEDFISKIYSKNFQDLDSYYWRKAGLDNTGAYTNEAFEGDDFKKSTNSLPKDDSEKEKSSTPKSIKRTLQQISLPGFSTIFGTKTRVCRRAMWIAILIICVMTSGFQVQDRIFYYLSSPVNVRVRVTRNETLHFPVITICNKNEYNVTALMTLRRELYAARNETPDVGVPGVDWNISELVGYRGMNAMDLWNYASHDLSIMSDQCFFGRNISCSKRGSWKKVYTYQGVCYSFQLNDTAVRLSGVFNNFYLRLQETEKNLYRQDDGWKLLIHDERESALTGIRTHGSSVYRGWGKDMRLYVRSFQTLNTKARPCIDDEDYSWSKCVDKCFVDTLAEKVPCLLPYMEGVPGKYCSTPESYNIATQVADNLLFFGEWSSANCSCARQCNQDIYIPYTESSVVEKHIGKLRVFFQDLTFDEVTESIDYTLIPLLCDIGGAMGLLLGASCLSLFEIFEAISIALFISGKTVGRQISKRRSTINKERSYL